jgi:hypothetical protein
VVEIEEVKEIKEVEEAEEKSGGVSGGLLPCVECGRVKVNERDTYEI